MKKLLACALLFLLTLSACAPLQSWDPEAWFPIWEETGETPENQEGVSMEFKKVEPVDERLWGDNLLGDRPEEDWSALCMELSLEEASLRPSAIPGWYIDYYCDGAWHTVYREAVLKNSCQEQAVARGLKAGTQDVSFFMPARVLDQPGKYRLCYGNFGAFPFEIKG